ncbi:ZIP family metal transporter [Candidatus Uhrbacteria bacterium]|nr:ZIP family metal transporter [Candidatus Uhrbacteria bacterium]
MLLLYILIFSALDGLAGILGAAFVIFRWSERKVFIKHLVSLAAGVMFAVAFFDLIPESIEAFGNVETALSLVLVGIIITYLLEKFLLWSHCHGDVCEAHRVAAPMVMVGDTFHNFLDGITVAAAFLVNIPLGILTALAVFVHEVPQEMGDVGTLLHLGFTRKKAIMFNVISEVIGVLGAVMVYFLGTRLDFNATILLALSAGGFIYIAGSDLLPAVHQHLEKKYLVSHALTFIFGIILFWILGQFFSSIGVSA